MSKTVDSSREGRNHRPAAKRNIANKVISTACVISYCAQARRIGNISTRVLLRPLSVEGRIAGNRIGLKRIAARIIVVNASAILVACEVVEGTCGRGDIRR